ncbi:aspartyl-phosphate phosphatase Spo0E family protein [Tepidibacter hydrothermalis]|uniref:Aspartyl-phosphate phosphatase Spo0E family protein n=1 Tax=Tepidibacter hydrothermalis TaxID=3036126 RepID=A0ABY8EJD7_9FIRM|nr:aspartyl-phosphate phosphatase Spo0E family protein [Tepidibacter hydrothermalis]WFD11053.1 aspartyl-phosphate phosphatase Spo0E family protein [Tepidibacter hydrothermalis]
MEKMNDLQMNIEVMRERLNKLIENNNFKLVNKEIIDLSQELDILLDNYVKLKKDSILS